MHLILFYSLWYTWMWCPFNYVPLSYRLSPQMFKGKDDSEVMWESKLKNEIRIELVFIYASFERIFMELHIWCLRTHLHVMFFSSWYALMDHHLGVHPCTLIHLPFGCLGLLYIVHTLITLKLYINPSLQMPDVTFTLVQVSVSHTGSSVRQGTPSEVWYSGTVVLFILFFIFSNMSNFIINIYYRSFENIN